MQRIPFASPDVAPAAELASTSHVRIKHAKELLDVDPKQFVYSGEVRGYSNPIVIATIFIRFWMPR